METEFKVFKGSYDSLEEDIKEYQKEHHLEIKSVVFIENYNAKTIIGVVFERSNEYEELEELEESILGFREWYTCKCRSARKRN